MVINISPNFSFKGWNIKEWIVGNKEAIKIAIGAIVALSYLYPVSAGWFVAGGVGVIIVKAILDIIDFWGSEVELTS